MDIDDSIDQRDANNSAFHSPMQLLKPSADHSCLVLVDETLEALSQVADPISVVTGVGTQRLGKSTLLNLFHSRVTCGFGLGHTLDAQLSTILAVAEQLRGNENEGQAECSKPAFVWILRDMQLKMVSKLEDSHLRKLRRIFRSYDCVPLPRPVDAEEQLQQVESMEFGQLKNTFLEEYYMLERQIFNFAAEPNCIGQEKVNGAILADMIGKYVNLIASRSGLLSSIASIPSCAEIISQMSSERAMKAATLHYDSNIATLVGGLPLSDHELFAAHEAVMQGAISTLKSAAIGVEDSDLALLADTLTEKAASWRPVERHARDCNAYCRFNILVGGALKSVMEQNRCINQNLCARAWDEIFGEVVDKVEKAEITQVEEYDAAISRGKAVALDAATLASTKEFMIYHLDEEHVRINIERYRNKVLMTSSQLSLLGQIMDMFDGKIQSLQLQLDSKINTISQNTTDQMKSLVGDLAKLRNENSIKHQRMECEITTIKSSLDETNEKLTTSEFELQAKINDNKKCMQEIEAELKVNINATLKSIEEGEKRNLANFQALNDQIKSELLIVSRDMDIKLSGVGGLLQEQVEITKAALESRQSELDAAVLGTHESLKTMKSSLEREIVAQADASKREIDAGIQVLRTELDRVDANAQRQIDENTRSVAATNSLLSRSAEESKQMCSVIRLETDERLSAIGIVFREEQSKAISMLTQQVETIRNNLLQLEQQCRSTFEDHTATLATANHHHEEMIRAAKEENSKDIASLGEIFGNELACTLREIEQKLSTSQDQMKILIHGNTTSLETAKLEFTAALQRTDENVNNFSSHILKEMHGLGEELRTEFASSFLEVNTLLSASREDLLIQISESKKMYQISADDLATSQKFLGERLDVLEAKSLDDLLNMARDIRKEHESAVFDLTELIKGARCEMDGHTIEVRCLVEKSFLEISAASEKAEALILSMRTDNSNELSSLRDLISEAVATVSEIAEQKIVRYSQDCQSQINAKRLEFEAKERDIRMVIENTINQFESAKCDFVKHTIIVATEIKGDILSEFARLNERIDEFVKGQGTAMQEIEEKMSRNFADLTIHDSFLQKLVEENIENVHGAHQRFQTMISTVEEFASKELALLQGKVQINASSQETIKLEFQSAFSELQLQIDASREAADSGIGEMTATQIAALQTEMHALQTRLDDTIISNGMQLAQLGKIYEEQIALARQDLQSQIDLCLIAHHEIMESIKQGISVPTEIKILDMARSEWKIDVSNANKEASVATATLKVDLGRLLSDLSAQMNLQISDTTATLKNAITSFDGRIDAVSKRTSQIEESVLNGAQSAAEYRQEVSQSFESVKKQLSEVQGQHTFCLTEMMQEKQEIAEMQLAFGQIQAEIVELVKKNEDCLQESTELKLELQSFRESKPQDGSASFAINDSLGQGATQGNLEELSSGIEQQNSCLRLSLSDIACTKAAHETSVEKDRGSLDAVNISLNRLKADHETLKNELTLYTVEYRHGAQEVACLKHEMSDIKERQTFCLNNIMQDRQRLCEGQLIMSQLQKEVADLMTTYSQINQDSNQTLVRSLCEYNQISDFSTTCLDCFERIDIIASILCSRLQVSMSEISSLKEMKTYHESQTQLHNPSLVQDVERISRNLADLQQHLCSSLSEMINERQEQLDMRLSVRELSKSMKEIEKRISNSSTYELDARHTFPDCEKSIVGAQLGTHQVENASNENAEASSVAVNSIDCLYARLKSLVANEITALRKELIESKMGNTELTHKSWVVTKLNQTGPLTVTTESKLGEGGNVEVIATQGRGKLEGSGREHSMHVLNISSGENDENEMSLIISEIKSELKQDIYWFRRETDAELQSLREKLDNFTMAAHVNQPQNAQCHGRMTSIPPSPVNSNGKRSGIESEGMQTSFVMGPYQKSEAIEESSDVFCKTPTRVREDHVHRRPGHAPSVGALLNSSYPVYHEEPVVLAQQVLRLGRNLDAVFQAVWHMQDTVQVLMDRAEAGFDVCNAAANAVAAGGKFQPACAQPLGCDA